MTDARIIEPPNETPTEFRHPATGRVVGVYAPAIERAMDESPHWERVDDPDNTSTTDAERG